MLIQGQNILYLQGDISCGISTSVHAGKSKALPLICGAPGIASLTNSLDIAVVHAGDMSNVDKTTFVWMVNIVETLEKLGAPLQHVYFTQGWVLAQPLKQCSCNSVVQLWYLLMPFCILFL